MVVKYWARVVGVGGSGLNFTTYAVVMLVVFYLQQLTPPLLPPIARLQRMTHRHEFASGWLCSFADDHWAVHSEYPPEDNTMTLKELVAGFFQFYVDFDYQYVICPLVGRPVPVNQIQNVNDIPEEMSLYKQKLENEPDNHKLKFKVEGKIRAQDPFELHWNITRNVSDNTFCVFISACKKSCKIMAEKDEKSLLGSLLSIDKDLLHSSVSHLKKVRFSFSDAKLDGASGTDTELQEQYDLITESVLAVVRHVVKANPVQESREPPVMNKVQKVETAIDVHTASHSEKDDDLVYNCYGISNIIDKRRSFFANLKDAESLCEFEQEVCVSNALQHQNNGKPFSFTIKISPFERAKLLKAVEVVIPYNLKGNKKVHVYTRELMNFIFQRLKLLVKLAMRFILKIKQNSSDSQPEQPLRDLVDLKLAKLADNAAESKEELSEANENQKVLLQQHTLLKSLEGNISKDK